MTTEKQLLANLQNAQLSTGPATAVGKTVVAANAIKHGIFTKDLILSSTLEHESEDEYGDLLNNLVACLSPCNQIESLLVEKIAVDFWRLRRTIRFETASIVQGIQKLLSEFYSNGSQSNEEIDEAIHYKQELLAWNKSYVECLAKGEVTFNKPEWQGNDISSDIIEDFYLLAKSITTLTKGEREKLYYTGDFSFDELRTLLISSGYADKAEISAKLIEIYSEQKQNLERDIQQLSEKRLMNDTSNKLTYMLGMTPATENTDKILKYERSLQKSIFQNLIMLKKLQEAF